VNCGYDNAAGSLIKEQLNDNRQGLVKCAPATVSIRRTSGAKDQAQQRVISSLQKHSDKASASEQIQNTRIDKKERETAEMALLTQ
jgi:hypothetical protein